VEASLQKLFRSVSAKTVSKWKEMRTEVTLERR